MNIVNCKNCNNQSDSKYCPSCGQFMNTHRINLQYLVHEIQHSIFHVDKGILYTIKELALRPGNTLTEYLSGKRVSHFKPFAFVTILATIYGLLSHYLHIYPEIQILNDTSQSQKTTDIAFDWLYKHYAFTTYLLIPFYALFSYILFKSKYNYFEHLVINAYLIGFQIILLIICLPFNYISTSLYFFLPTIVSFLYFAWTFHQIFNNQLFTSIFKTVLITILSSILGLILGLIGGGLFTNNSISQ